MKKEDELGKELKGKEDFEELSTETFLQIYCDELPEDTLTIFRNYILEFRK